MILLILSHIIEKGSDHDTGLSNLGRVKETLTEDNVLGEGIIYYDIRFTAYHKEAERKILVNIEAQKSSDPSK